MTIGIFGDSFGDWDVKNGELKTISWPYIVAGQLGRSCINMCNGGASLFYSYKTFLENQSQCDRVIFLLTNPGRYTKPMYFENRQPNRKHVNSLSTVEHMLFQKGLSNIEKQNLEFLKGFYISQDFEWEHTACNLLVEKIRRVRPDVVLVPCFNFYQDKTGSTVTLQDLMDLQCKSLGVNLTGMDFIDRYTEKNVVCHFTDSTNQFVAQQMIESLQNGQWTCTLPDSIVHAHDVNYYYERKFL